MTAGSDGQPAGPLPNHWSISCLLLGGVKVSIQQHFILLIELLCQKISAVTAGLPWGVCRYIFSTSALFPGILFIWMQFGNVIRTLAALTTGIEFSAHILWKRNHQPIQQQRNLRGQTSFLSPSAQLINPPLSSWIK